MTETVERDVEEYEQCCGCSVGGDGGNCQCLCCCGRIKVGGIRW